MRKPGPEPKRAAPPAERRSALLPPLRPEQPVRYSKEFAERVACASAAGFTVTEVARMLGVSVDQVNLWSMVYAEFAAAMRANDQARTERAEAALYQRAVGYEHLAEKLVRASDDSILRPLYYEHIPADPTAAMNWLKAHAPARYRFTEQESGEGAEIVVRGGLPDE